MVNIGECGGNENNGGNRKREEWKEGIENGGSKRGILYVFVPLPVTLFI